MRIDLEREYLVDDMLAREIKWMEEERLYYEEKERNKRLPALIRVMIPNYININDKPAKQTLKQSKS